MSLDLTVLEKTSPVELFNNNGLDPLLEAITKEVTSIALDVTTEKGRKEIASLAHKVAKSKTALDKMGKDLVANQKEEIKKVDKERARAWDYLEDLQHKIRKPLTDFEEREKKRIQSHELKIAWIQSFKMLQGEFSSVELNAKIAELSGLLIDKEFEEYQSMAQAEKEKSLAHLNEVLSKRIQYEAEQAELKRLREEEEARKQKEREELIAKQAAEKARVEAEEKAKAEQARVEKEKQEAIEKQKKAEEAARLEKERAQQEKIQAEKRAQEAAKKAEEDKQKAIEAERLRIQKEQERAAEEAKKREQDIAHRKLINNEILTALKAECGLDDVAGKVVIESIVKSKIPNVKISY